MPDLAACLAAPSITVGMPASTQQASVAWSDALCRRQEDRSSPGGDIEHCIPRPYPRKLHQAPTGIGKPRRTQLRVYRRHARVQFADYRFPGGIPVAGRKGHCAILPGGRPILPGGRNVLEQPEIVRLVTLRWYTSRATALSASTPTAMSLATLATNSVRPEGRPGGNASGTSLN
jgi:hypothetical protein